MMAICPHCGWENPGDSAFCTNCGRGLARVRSARFAVDDDDASVSGEALPLGPLVGAVAQPIEDDEESGDHDVIAPPALRPPPGAQVVRDAMPTLVDFRLPLDALVQRIPADVPPIVTADFEAVVPLEDSVDVVDEELDDEPPLGAPLLVGLLPKRRPDALLRQFTPPELPEDSPLRIARIIADDSDDAPHAVADAAESAEPSEDPGEDPIEEMVDLSTSDLDAVDPPLVEANLLDSGEQVAQVIAPARPPSPPPPPPSNRGFVLRRLSDDAEAGETTLIDASPLTIGREDSDLCVGSDEAMSAQHARVSLQGDRLFIEDLGSVNGTWLRVRGAALLGPGAGVRIGHQVLRLERRPVAPSLPMGDGTRRTGASRPRNGWRLLQLSDDGLELAMWSLPDDGARLGRHVADIVFPDDNFLSGTHAVLTPREEAVQLRDLGSRNGTWVRLDSAFALEPGDAVLMGDTIWRVGTPV